MSLTLRVAETETDIAACMALRWTVFVEEQGVPEADELDGTDVGCTHVIAIEAGQAVGAARFKVDDDVAKIGRVCVAQEQRGAGTGAAMIRFICDICGASKARLGAQVAAMRFYQRLGFEPVGDVFMDAGIPHQDMERDL